MKTSRTVVGVDTAKRVTSRGLAPLDGGCEAISVSLIHCQICGDSDSRRELERMLAAMEHAGWMKLLAAEGSERCPIEFSAVSI